MGEHLEPVLMFVRNQNAQVCSLLPGYRLAFATVIRTIAGDAGSLEP
jgi:hypothetical protein